MLQEQSAVSCSGSRGKRLRTLSEEDQNVDYGTSPVTVPEIHDKDEEEEDEESRKKVYSTLILCFSFCNPSLSELFSPYYFLYISRCWQGECFEQSRASLVGDHFMYSHDLHVWFRSVTVMRNYLPVTLGSQRVIHNGKLWATENLLVS